MEKKDTKTAKPIMIQGTMSNAGKSLLAAGLCRIFTQDGYRVAPFKSQNMALNSFITSEGLEMGRAQVMQAECCHKEPSALMNPILLKPTSDVGSQVIVNGIPRETMNAKDYFRYKRQLIPDILAAYETLARQNDIIVIEGAGSPAEINLKSDDIVNMGLAEMVDAPVLLVGDIDRGGVFAQLVGTVMLLEEEERARIKGLIINKFRGDKSILDPGIEMLEEKCGIPVVGVVPYLHLEVEDEDSLTERFSKKREAAAIDLAVIRLPRISNFTDFNPLETIPGVSVRYVCSVRELGSPDVIFLPGTKSTIPDLLWMRQNGLEAAVFKHAAAGKIVFGICGGYQMLGETISDPSGAEGGGSVRGMGLLPIDTVFEPEKRRTRVRGQFREIGGPLGRLSGVSFEGYEIHMGKSERRAGAEPLCGLCLQGDARSGEEPGAAIEGPGSVFEKGNHTMPEEPAAVTDGTFKDNVYGSYVHGLFDRAGMTEAFLRSVAAQKGIPPREIAAMDYAAFKETQYDLLADGLRASVDLEKIYQIMMM